MSVYIFTYVLDPQSWTLRLPGRSLLAAAAGAIFAEGQEEAAVPGGLSVALWTTVLGTFFVLREPCVHLPHLFSSPVEEQFGGDKESERDKGTQLE